MTEKSDPVEVMAEAIEQSMREISVGEDADGMSYGLLDAIADARGEPDLSGAGDVLRDAALDVARSALAAAESAGMVMVPKVATEAMRAAIDGDTPYVSRRNKTYDDGRIYEVIRMDNANWRTTITDDQTVMGRFPNSQEADALCAKLAFEFRYAAMIEAASLAQQEKP